MTALLSPIGQRSWWLNGGPPWASSKKSGGTPWSHFWTSDLRKISFTSFPNQPTVSDQIGSVSLTPSSESLGTDTAFPTAPLYYLKNTPTSTGHRYLANAVASEISGTAIPVTILLASYIPTTPTATYNPFGYGNTTSATKRLRVLATGSSTSMQFERVNDAASGLSLTWTRTTGPFVWVLQYNGASSFVRENGVEVASGSLGTGACTLNTFTLGASTTTSVIQACGMHTIGLGIASGLALTYDQYAPVEAWFIRRMRL